MIHDAKIEVTCDNDDCNESVDVSPPYVYRTLRGDDGCYDTSDDTIKRELKSAHGWEVRERYSARYETRTLHFCCEECAAATFGDRR